MNKLSLNIEKTQYCIFKSGNKSLSEFNNLTLTIDSKTVSKVSSCKYLGIVLDENLTFEEHINNTVAKVNKFCGILYKLRYKLPNYCMKTIYFALINSHLIYGIEIYGNTSITHLDPLIKVNNKLLRIIQNRNRRAHIYNLYNEYNTLPINYMFEFKILTFMHKYKFYKNELPEIYHNYFTYNNEIHSHDTKSSGSFHMEQANKNFGKRNLKILGSKLWNALPKTIQAIHSFGVFKRKIKLILLKTFKDESN